KSYTTSSALSCPIQYSIEGKCALVVDGTSGVGHAFANELLKRNAAKIIITGSNSMEGTETAYEFNKNYGRDRVNFHKMDIANPLEFKNMFKYIKTCFMPLDIFFNNSESSENDDVVVSN
ncbi:short-chain dehydrogenase reductase 3a-like, partial [Aphis craccivora]